MAEFFYRCGLNEYGPITSTELKRLAQTGRIGASHEVRQGRTGKWLPMTSLPGLAIAPVRHEERAINEMDVLTEAASRSMAPVAGSLSESDTAVGSEAESREVPAFRRPELRSPAASHPLPQPEAGLRQWATVIVAVSYIAAATGLVTGIVILLGERSLLHSIFAGVCFLVALVGVASGCTISLLLSLRGRPHR
jgi:hypothetical protein